MCALVPGLWLFLPPGSTPEKDTATSTDQHHDEQPWLHCRTCGQAIVQQSARVSVNGMHQHVFFNPAGLVFEIGCFENAPGCFCQGQPRTDFTWFPEYAWHFALCTRCGSHLGWRYEKARQGFFGLILTQLTAPE